MMYTSPHQFGPLLPQRRHDELEDKAYGIAERALRLAGSMHPATGAALRERVRAMNSYYSNRIEGQGTHPVNIERALKADFSGRPDIARLQHIALAHIDAEREIERHVAAQEWPLTSDFARHAHAALYSRLAPEDRTTADGLIVEPGALRDRDVDVGRHVPPAAATVPAFLARLDEVFGKPVAGARLLLHAACVHQRMAWVHPFLDGNGRAVRLVTHGALLPLSGGLWSANRAFARDRDGYYAALADADSPRRGDLDGRGNLSDQGLARWCDYFLGACDDQVRFMSGLLGVDGYKRRLAGLIAYWSVIDRQVRPETVLPLHHVFVAGPVARGEFAQMTGLGERTARAAISHLLKRGLLRSDSSAAPLRLGLPLDALPYLFPDLYPEAATRHEDDEG